MMGFRSLYTLFGLLAVTWGLKPPGYPKILLDMFKGYPVTPGPSVYGGYGTIANRDIQVGEKVICLPYSRVIGRFAFSALNLDKSLTYLLDQKQLNADEMHAILAALSQGAAKDLRWDYSKIPEDMAFVLSVYSSWPDIDEAWENQFKPSSDPYETWEGVDELHNIFLLYNQIAKNIREKLLTLDYPGSEVFRFKNAEGRFELSPHLTEARLTTAVFLHVGRRFSSISGLSAPVEERGLILPLLEVMNHSPACDEYAQKDCRFVSGEDGFCFVSRRTYRKGDEVFWSYGHHGINSFLTYGFMATCHQKDHVKMRFKKENVLSGWEPPKRVTELTKMTSDTHHIVQATRTSVEGPLGMIRLLKLAETKASGDVKMDLVFCERGRNVTECGFSDSIERSSYIELIEKLKSFFVFPFSSKENALKFLQKKGEKISQRGKTVLAFKAEIMGVIEDAISVAQKALDKIPA